MKNHIFLGILITVLLVSFTIFSGCTSQEAAPSTPTPTTAIDTTVQTTVQTTPTPTTSLVPVSFTNEDVNKHFMTIAFGPTNTKLYKIYTSGKVNFNGQYRNDNKEFITEFARSYNKFTDTRTFRSPLEIDIEGDDDFTPNINYYPPAYIHSISTIYKETVPDKGTILYAISYPKWNSYPAGGGYYAPSVYYINSMGVPVNTRNHYTMKAVLHHLGFSGETYDYPDSFFYVDNRNGTNLSPIDKAAIKVMYNPALLNGMSKEAVEDVLFIGN